MRNLAFIPARGGSKGVPGKNMRLLNGKPLIFYTFEWAKKSNIFSDIFVSTDCPITLEYSIKIGAKFTNLRSNNSNLDSQSASELILSHQNNKTIDLNNYDFIWYLQPTSPQREKNIGKHITSLINKNKNIDSLASFILVPKKYNPEWQFRINEKGYIFNDSLNLISNKKELSNTYIRDGRFYITKTSYFLKYKKLIGEKCFPILLDSKNNVNIDNIDDWNKAKKYINDIPINS